READIDAGGNAALNLLAVPDDVVVDDLGEHPAIEDEPLAHKAEGARQNERARIVRIDVEPFAADMLLADLAFLDAHAQVGQGGRRDLTGALNLRIGEDGAKLAEVER